jgi:hypothetical protein
MSALIDVTPVIVNELEQPTGEPAGGDLLQFDLAEYSFELGSRGYEPADVLWSSGSRLGGSFAWN